MKRHGKYYLAHSCFLIKSVRKWELYVQGHYDIDLVNPFAHNDFENVDELKEIKTKRQLQRYMESLPAENRKKILEHDLELVRKCDGLVTIMKDYTAGTCMELFACAYLYRMPIYVISTTCHEHPWISHLIRISGGKWFKYRKDFERYLEERGMKKKV